MTYEEAIKILHPDTTFLEYIADFNRWLNEEPPILRFISWHKWKKTRPKRRAK